MIKIISLNVSLLNDFLYTVHFMPEIEIKFTEIDSFKEDYKLKNCLSDEYNIDLTYTQL